MLKKTSAERPQQQQQQLQQQQLQQQQLQQQQHQQRLQHHLPHTGRSIPRQDYGTFPIMKIQLCLDAICFEKSMNLKMTASTSFFFQLHQQNLKQLR